MAAWVAVGLAAEASGVVEKAAGAMAVVRTAEAESVVAAKVEAALEGEAMEAAGKGKAVVAMAAVAKEEDASEVGVVAVKRAEAE